MVSRLRLADIPETSCAITSMVAAGISVVSSAVARAGKQPSRHAREAGFVHERSLPAEWASG